MRKTKQGVSLIVLVITIIVMIVLASAVIISLSNTDIINRANEAVDANNLKEVQSIATTAWTEAFIDKIDDPTVNLTDRVMKALEDNKVNINKYDIEVTETGVTVTAKEQAGGNTSNVPEEWKANVREVTEDEVPIPNGFVKSPYPNEGTKNGGLVIYALTEDEIKDGKTTITDEHDVALKGRNQFVWVPVDRNDFETLFRRKDFTNATSKISYTLGDKVWELILESNNMPSDNTKNTTNYISPATLKEATEMYASVKKYGGFYIARYEVGSKTVENDAKDGYIATRVNINKGTNSNLSVTMGKYPYNVVPWGTSMQDETSDEGAVSLAREFYSSTETTYGVVSTLTYGVQWDRTLDWWEEMDIIDGKDDINLKDSTSYGVYKNTTIASADINAGAKYTSFNGITFDAWKDLTAKTSTNASWLVTTGGYTKANVYNIYDMAGNLIEWTMEGLGNQERLYRGGVFDSAGDVYSVIVRSYADHALNQGDEYFGFRPSLYIK